MMLSARTMYMSLYPHRASIVGGNLFLFILVSGRLDTPIYRLGIPSGFYYLQPPGFRSGASRVPVQYTTKASKKKKSLSPVGFSTRGLSFSG
jgi:hypothetical protein